MDGDFFALRGRKRREGFGTSPNKKRYGGGYFSLYRYNLLNGRTLKGDLIFF